MIYLDGRPSTTEALDRLPVQQLERVHVFKGEGAEAEVGADPACGVVVALTKGASPEEADAGRRLVERLTAATRGAEAVGTGRSLEEVAEEPTFTPMTVRPALKNPDEVREALDRLYPPLLKESGIGGVVNVWFFIDREGVVRKTRLRARSGHEALDQAALAVAEVMEFTPAYNREQRVPVWVALDIRFETGPMEPAQDDVVSEGRDAMEHSRPLAGQRVDPSDFPGVTPRADRTVPPDPNAGPTFTPMTKAPRLKNGVQVSDALERLYPPLLRDAGIGGTANVWFLIDDEGRVAKVQIRESSGREELDAAALEIARGMRFEPARNGDEPVTVWVALDITFATE
jgi:TonB family protein